MTSEELAAEIERIQAVLRAGVTSSTVDGVATTYDLAELRRQLRQLQAEQAAAAGEPAPRPLFRNIGATFRD